MSEKTQSSFTFKGENLTSEQNKSVCAYFGAKPTNAVKAYWHERKKSKQNDTWFLACLMLSMVYALHSKVLNLIQLNVGVRSAFMSLLPHMCLKGGVGSELTSEAYNYGTKRKGSYYSHHGAQIAHGGEVNTMNYAKYQAMAVHYGVDVGFFDHVAYPLYVHVCEHASIEPLPKEKAAQAYAAFPEADRPKTNA